MRGGGERGGGMSGYLAEILVDFYVRHGCGTWELLVSW